MTPTTMSTTDKNASPPRGGLSEWGWFFAWVALGVALALGAVSFGPLLLVPAAVVVALITSRRGLGRSALGLLTGAGIIALVIAYLQRKGPGTVYWHTATAGGADTYLDPRPWLTAGILLVAGGILGFVLARRTARHSSEVERPT